MCAYCPLLFITSNYSYTHSCNHTINWVPIGCLHVLYSLLFSSLVRDLVPMLCYITSVTQQMFYHTIKVTTILIIIPYTLNVYVVSHFGFALRRYHLYTTMKSIHQNLITELSNCKVPNS